MVVADHCSSWTERDLKRWLCILLAVCAMGAVPVSPPAAPTEEAGEAPAFAQSVELDTIRAAQANAVQNLYAEVARLPLGGTWTVGSYLTAIDGQDDFLRLLSRRRHTMIW